MEAGTKRKRGDDRPRITFRVGDRTFARLLNDESLLDVKNNVRKKLGIDSDSEIRLAQLHEGELIDLEDEADFDAFYVFAYANKAADVRITIDQSTHLMSKNHQKVHTTLTENDDDIAEPPKKRARQSKTSKTTAHDAGPSEIFDSSATPTTKPVSKRAKHSTPITKAITQLPANKPKTVLAEAEMSPESSKPKKKTKVATKKEKEKSGVVKSKSNEQAQADEPTLIGKGGSKAKANTETIAKQIGQREKDAPEGGGEHSMVYDHTLPDDTSVEVPSLKKKGTTKTIDSSVKNTGSAASLANAINRAATEEPADRSKGKKKRQSSIKSAAFVFDADEDQESLGPPKKRKKQVDATENEKETVGSRIIDTAEEHISPVPPPKRRGKSVGTSVVGEEDLSKKKTKEAGPKEKRKKTTGDVGEDESGGKIIPPKRNKKKSDAEDKEKDTVATTIVEKDLPATKSKKRMIIEEHEKETMSKPTPGKSQKLIHKVPDQPTGEKATEMTSSSKKSEQESNISSVPKSKPKKVVSSPPAAPADLIDVSNERPYPTGGEARLVKKSATNIGRQEEEEDDSELDNVNVIHSTLIRQPHSSSYLTGGLEDDPELSRLLQGPKSRSFHDILVPSDENENSESDPEPLELEEEENEDPLIKKKIRNQRASMSFSGAPLAMLNQSSSSSEGETDNENTLNKHVECPPIISRTAPVNSTPSSNSSITQVENSDIPSTPLPPLDITLLETPSNLTFPDGPLHTSTPHSASVPRSPSEPEALTPECPTSPSNEITIRLSQDPFIRLTTPQQFQDDPIESADEVECPESPITDAPVIPSTPRSGLRLRMRDKSGNLQLSSIKEPQIPTESSKGEADVPSLSQDESIATRRTRRATRSQSVAVILPRVRRKNATPSSSQTVLEKDSAASKEKAVVVKSMKPRSAAKPPSKSAQMTVPTASAEKTHAVDRLTPVQSWVTLPNDSYQEAEDSIMIDQLNPSSPGDVITARPVTTSDEPSTQHNPLFIPAESQAQFPYSQWQTQRPHGDKQEEEDSTNESEDEQEVAKVISQTSLSQPNYRKLSDIASMPAPFSSLRRQSNLPPRLSQMKQSNEDLYGDFGDKSDEDNDSSSDEDKQVIASHIPRGRIAGASKLK